MAQDGGGDTSKDGDIADIGHIDLHYVLDLWVHPWRKRDARGEVCIVRYADDSVWGFRCRCDGERFMGACKECLARFGLSLNEEKTRLSRVVRVHWERPRGR